MRVPMVSREKLYTKLDLLETELKTLLVPHLQTAAHGGNDLVFCVTAFNPFPELKSRTDTVTEELVDMGAQVLALKSKLGENSEGSIAARICWYCRAWGAADKNDRKSAQGLAQQFLLEIEKASRET